MLSTAWPWPYAPQGLPALTVQMNRPNPFNPADGLGDGSATVHPDWPGGQALQPVEPQSHAGQGELPGQRRQKRYPGGAEPGELLIEPDRRTAMINPAFLAAGSAQPSQHYLRLRSPAASRPPLRTRGARRSGCATNKTTVKVSNGTPKTAAEGQKIADALMAQWKAKKSEQGLGGRWKWRRIRWCRRRKIPRLVGTGQSSTYGAVTQQDVQVWGQRDLQVRSLRLQSVP